MFHGIKSSIQIIVFSVITVLAIMSLKQYCSNYSAPVVEYKKTSFGADTPFWYVDGLQVGTPIVMQNDTNPDEMKLYLTKDYRLVWICNGIADKFGKIETASRNSTDQLLTIQKIYVDLITYANVNVHNIEEKQSLNLKNLVKEIAKQRANFILNKTYNEIFTPNIYEKKVQEFSANDVSVLIKNGTLCVSVAEETLNIIYELDMICNILTEKGLDTRHVKRIIESNRVNSSKNR